ncbi:MAG: NAD-dependent epimerase/dehydratase family protein [Myxococcota bacterium]
MKILITGGAGFLGLHLSRYFHTQGHELVLLDIDEYRKHEYPPERIKFIRGDVRKKRDVDLALQDVDAVIHAAAALPLWEVDEIYSTNVFGTRTLLERCRKTGLNRIIFVSSTAVYGVPRVHPLLEYFPLVGVGDYGESKILAEKICEQFRRQGMKIGIIRPKTFIGPYRLGVFQILFDWINGGHRIPLIGKGNNRYQLLDVLDLVKAFELMLLEKDDDIFNDTYNVGAIEFGIVREDISALCKYAGSGSKPLPLPAKPVIGALKLFEKFNLSPLYEWVYGTAHRDSFVSVEKIRNKLGWEPEHSNSSALIRSYQWYMENKNYSDQAMGLTHTVAWDQGILKLFKKVL